MKPVAAVSLIISGAMFVLAPYVANLVSMSQLAYVMAQTDRTVSLKSNLPGWYDVACFIAGAVMILVGVIGSVQRSDAAVPGES